MPLDPLGSLSDPTCHGCIMFDQACAKLTLETSVDSKGRNAKKLRKCRSPLR